MIQVFQSSVFENSEEKDRKELILISYKITYGALLKTSCEDVERRIDKGSRKGIDKATDGDTDNGIDVYKRLERRQDKGNKTKMIQ